MAEKLNLTGGYKLPAIGFGVWQVKDESELEVALNTALEVGYRHIDTAYAYENEHVVGRVVNQWISSGKLKREDVFITTKLPMAGVHKDRVETYLKSSLDSLQLDYIDLFLIHFPIACKPAESDAIFAQCFNLDADVTDHVAVWKKLEEQVDAGKVKSIGISNFNQRQIKKILDSARIKPACLQIELHVYLQQRDLVKFCQDNGIVVVAYSPLGSPGYNKFTMSIGARSKELPNMLEDPVVKSIAAKHRKTNAQVMLRYLLEKKCAAIPKSVTPSRIKANFNVFDFTLDSDDIKRLDDLDAGEAGRVCDFKLLPGLDSHPEWPFPK